MYFAYLYHKNIREKKNIIVLKVVLVLLRRWRRKTRLWIFRVKRLFLNSWNFMCFFLLFFKITFKLKWDCLEGNYLAGYFFHHFVCCFLSFLLRLKHSLSCSLWLVLNWFLSPFHHKLYDVRHFVWVLAARRHFLTSF